MNEETEAARARIIADMMEALEAFRQNMEAVLRDCPECVLGMGPRDQRDYMAAMARRAFGNVLMFKDIGERQAKESM